MSVSSSRDEDNPDRGEEGSQSTPSIGSRESDTAIIGGDEGGRLVSSESVRSMLG